jgi:hypothetical protein
MTSGTLNIGWIFWRYKYRWHIKIYEKVLDSEKSLPLRTSEYLVLQLEPDENLIYLQLATNRHFGIHALVDAIVPISGGKKHFLYVTYKADYFMQLHLDCFKQSVQVCQDLKSFSGQIGTSNATH